jgi:hypothetical protein
MMTSGVAREEGTNVHDVHVIVTEQGAPGLPAPHLLDEALSWHPRYLRDGSMGPELTVRQPAGE